MLFTILFPPFFPILWLVFLSDIYKFAFQVAAQRAFSEHVFALLFFMELGWNHDLSFFLLCFPAHSQLLTLKKSNPKLLRHEQTEGLVQAKPVDVWVGVEREGAGPERRQSVPGRMCTWEQGTGVWVLFSCSRYMSRPVGLAQEGLCPEC